MSIKHFATLRRGAFLAVALSGTAIAASAAHAGPVFTFNDTADNVQAVFTQNGTTLAIRLINNGTTGSNTDLLDGLFFNISSNPTVSLGSGPNTLAPNLLTSNDNGKTVSTSANVDISGSWQLKSTGFTFNSTSYKYGLSAVGGNGLFASNLFTKGNGSDDYGLVGSKTIVPEKGLTQFPLASGEIDFTLTLSSSDITIGDVAFGFNSALSDVVAGIDPPPPAVAEPGKAEAEEGERAGLAALRRRAKA
jgi:hypothetical protein